MMALCVQWRALICITPTFNQHCDEIIMNRCVYMQWTRAVSYRIDCLQLLHSKSLIKPISDRSKALHFPAFSLHNLLINLNRILFTNTTNQVSALRLSVSYETQALLRSLIGWCPARSAASERRAQLEMGTENSISFC